MANRTKPLLLEPARTVIERVGGIEAAAQATGCDFSRVYRWMRPREVGGTDGFVPARHQHKLIEYAKKNGKPLTPNDFFCAA